MTVAALDLTQLTPLLDLLDGSEVVLGSFTEEEIAAVDPPDDDPLVPLPLLDPLSEGARASVMATAMRSLMARGLVSLADDPERVLLTGALATAVSLRSAPNSVLIVEHVEADDPARVVVYGTGIPADSGRQLLLMEESVALLGHHDFVLRSVEGQAAVLAEWLGTPAPSENGEVPGGGTLDAALDEPRSVTRLYALRREDDGSDAEGEFSEVELTLVDGGPHGKWMVLFQPGTDGDREGILAVPVERLDLPAVFAALLRLDLGPFNVALAAG